MVTLALIALNVLAFAAEVLFSGMRFDIPTMVLVNMGAMYAPLVQAGEVWRLVTPMFLHMDVMHLPSTWWRFSAWARCWSACWDAATSCFCTSLAALRAMRCRSRPTCCWGGGPTVSAGASTSVFGLFVAVALLGVLHKGNRRMFAEYSKGMLGIIGVNVVYTLLVPSISVSGHLGGALGGLVAMFMVPAKNLCVPNAVRAVVAVLWVAALAWLAVRTGGARVTPGADGRLGACGCRRCGRRVLRRRARRAFQRRSRHPRCRAHMRRRPRRGARRCRRLHARFAWPALAHVVGARGRRRPRAPSRGSTPRRRLTAFSAGLPLAA